MLKILSQFKIYNPPRAEGNDTKDHAMPIFLLDLILSAVMIGLLLYLVIATTPPEHL